MEIRRQSSHEHFTSPGPKRILCLDGGGVRGVLTLGVLRQVEEMLRRRHGGSPAFRLCEYFDLIAGTSTGAIIAAALAQGMSVGDVQVLYRKLAHRIFERSFFRRGFLRAKYSAVELTSMLKEVFGEHAATWMVRYEQSGDRADLERSRQLYLEAFKLSPQDEYVGINAASKSAFLGELTFARQLAEEVKSLTAKFADGSDFYKSMSYAEALVLLGDYAGAGKTYSEARLNHPERSGDIEGTISQLRSLIKALEIPEAAARTLVETLGA